MEDEFVSSHAELGLKQDGEFLLGHGLRSAPVWALDPFQWLSAHTHDHNFIEPYNLLYTIRVSPFEMYDQYGQLEFSSNVHTYNTRHSSQGLFTLPTSKSNSMQHTVMYRAMNKLHSLPLEIIQTKS